MEFDLIHLKHCSSTNDYAKEHYSSFDSNKITLIRADEQTAGRGRFGNSWVTTPGKNLTLSFVFRLKKEQKDIAALAELLSFSAAIVLKSLGFAPQVKWPNDLFVERKKIAGVLCEAISTDEALLMIAGIGLNVNMSEEECGQVGQPATSLFVLRKKEYNLDELLGLLMREFHKDLTLFKEKGFAPFAKEYEKLLSFLNKEVTILDGAHEVRGTCIGLESDGRLKLKTEEGKIVICSNGKVKK